MGLSLLVWDLRIKRLWVLVPVDHLSEVVPYPTMTSTRTPASKVPAIVMRTPAWGELPCGPGAQVRDEERSSS